ncbi:MFS transporter [Candidatus Kaiserbacteria bacterium CG10_big_fil_rev_8_21_14_0_10_51_14]|uniref:MFS transporter n=1 Tax=Candidatus Kaiserbacteria bacterium CG10_big_fil_rev_8_21_14_0_10_51_14 TaxID=1974610 RepID=A0A2H0UCL9_9BACT|nr:MAG: MFS transporter [Candidatus Kaiserbacteria bacterium CG10_big_fil_rev_8_21_14_0_10_51_14]
MLIFSQLLAGVGLAAGITVGALLVQDMVGSTSSAGIPAALFTLGSALAAVLIGRVSQKSGRRHGLAAGYCVGSLGGAGVLLAVATNNIPLLFVSLFIYGSGTAANFQARYAGADLADPAYRGRAISIVLIATTLGAVLGPNLVEWSGGLAHALDLRSLAGPFILSTITYALAGLAVLLLLRPDPLIVARTIASKKSEETSDRSPKTHNSRLLYIGAGALVISQMVMIAIMTMTPIHMLGHGASLGAAGLVISIHIAGMFLPSPLSGMLVDRIGEKWVLVLGSLTMLTAGFLAAFAPADSLILLALALAFLGLGWNFTLVAGSAMVTHAAPLEMRASMQGKVDSATALAGAAGGMSSGFILVATSYATLSLLSGLLALLILPMLLIRKTSRMQPEGAATLRT